MPKETCPDSYVWSYNFIQLTAIKNVLETVYNCMNVRREFLMLSKHPCNYNCLEYNTPARKVKVKSLHTGQVAHHAGAYPSFCSMKRLGVLLLPGWDASPSWGCPQH